MTSALAAAARGLVGTPFRLQGRDPATGLDCVGLVLASLAQVGVRLDLPADYRPRRRSFVIPEVALLNAGLIAVTGLHGSGDILLLRTAPAQVHAAIAHDGASVIHAHAGLGRVVLGPIPPDWPTIAAWRLAPLSALKETPQWPR
ncbi:NlpC/P60 family protein [Alteriqipengyuania lutimaris]|uniref:NlpC/P60 domain-containing protein n=1 Tax=Alteriqipengyuania lutimaris TaxID=1538146 RepID=A0A395LPF9_9SPHN|nr:NlpC/P60 family protein [Alteriqipengyuania lutimaris]MBB3034534.1 cell wall-associated NlpC family hydrolase [Alteriqipengyuania lutimaris]RDS76580.1 hypothetical protein DL238_02485 [Alteriqipengyuania lutimaris]